MNSADNFIDCTCYRIKTDQDLLVAVPPEQQEIIKELIKEFGTLSAVPVSKTVRGIFVRKNPSGDLLPVSGSQQQNDITVNQLEILNN